MSKELKEVPFFKTEDEEREFWATHSSEDYVDFDTLVSIPAPMVPKTSQEEISRLEEMILNSKTE